MDLGWDEVILCNLCTLFHMLTCLVSDANTYGGSPVYHNTWTVIDTNVRHSSY